jgi:hypothetical protein
MMGLLKNYFPYWDGGTTMFSSRKPDPFFTALLTIAENVQEAVHYANDFKVVTVADLKEVSIKLKN